MERKSTISTIGRTIAKEYGISIDKGVRITKSVLNEIKRSIIEGKRVSLHHFGGFSKRFKKPRRFFNTRTKQCEVLNEFFTVHFIPAVGFKNKLNEEIK